MVRKILLGLAVLMVVLVGVGFLLPSTARVERSTVVKAAPEDVFVIVNDLTRFKEWNPWSENEPKMALTLSGPPMGVGATMTWSSDVLGAGRLEIVESTPYSAVRLKLLFDGAGEGHATLSLAPTMGGTNVVWSYEADLGFNPVSRYLGLLMDQWVGADYARGLARLKVLVEALAEANTLEALSPDGSMNLATDLPDMLTPPDADPNKGPEVVAVQGRSVIRVRGEAPESDNAAISAALGEAYNKLLAFAEQNEVNVGGGAPQAVTISNTAGVWAFEASMPLASLPGQELIPVEGVSVGKSYSGRAVKLTHKGPYSSLPQSFERLRAFARENKLKEKGLLWEEYVSDPAELGEDQLLTNVYLAVD